MQQRVRQQQPSLSRNCWPDAGLATEGRLIDRLAQSETVARQGRGHARAGPSPTRAARQSLCRNPELSAFAANHRTGTKACPTATGKTELAMRVARAVGGEIVSADAMAVYRGMDIGTAKPDTLQRRLVRFHLIDYVELNETYSLHRFLRDCEAAVRDIWARGRLPIVCGGTGLYVEAFMEGYELPATDAAQVRRLRAELEDRLTKEGLNALVEQLRTLDPSAPEQVDTANPRRVIRAIEIVTITGRPLADARVKRRPGGYIFSPWLIACPRHVLRRRIDRRVDAMMAAGWLDEVRGLLDRFPCATTALQAIGYRHLVRYLTEGGSLSETLASIKADTRKYAKRQLTWWRRKRIPQLMWETSADFAAIELLLIRAARDLLAASIQGRGALPASGQPNAT
ncbi:MAG: tRNA (adenosine(37)-N6)-dimethylallyltransferase MiaA [Armatimonadetes bacterium]|nr:tRNA (adenosine(37)-N6)-dimethylallyltransferase MiaA [Armatimonadota bacterium]